MLVSRIDEKNLGKILRTVEFSEDVILLSNWSPSIFQNGIRNNSNFLSTSLLVLDVDSGCTLEQARSEFDGHKYIIASTKSHQKEKNGIVCDRFRVVLFLDKEVVTKEDYNATWNIAYKLWPFIDRACKDPARFFYPSEEILATSTGAYFLVNMGLPPRAANIPDSSPKEVKGDLWKSTLKFLLEGAPPGFWHQEFIKASGNMREQGYSFDEAHEKLSNITGVLDETDEKQLRDMYTRPVKYDFKPQSQHDESTQPQPTVIRASELLRDTFEYLSDKELVKGDATGIEGLDKLLGGGFRLGEITVLMAEAKTGKNSLYHFMMEKIMARGVAQGYASRELDPANEVIPNLLSIAFQKNAWTQDITDDYKQRAQEEIKKWKLWFSPGYGYFPMDEIENWFRELTKLGVNHFWMDHLHYMLQDEDYKEASRVMRKLKTLAKQLKIHINLIVQPTKLMEGQRLSLGSLKGGSAIGQALDNLLVLERVKNHPNISKLTLDVARHKLAKPGHIYLQYNSDTTCFDEAEIVEDPMPTPGLQLYARTVAHGSTGGQSVNNKQLKN